MHPDTTEKNNDSSKHCEAQHKNYISVHMIKFVSGTIEFKRNIKYYCFKTFSFLVFISHSSPRYVSDDTAGLLSLLKQLSLR
jgi:hypothetical protein